MKILHISYRDCGGGAAGAATLLHQCLRRKGVDSQMRVVHQRGNDPYTQTIDRGLSKASWCIEKKFSKLTEHLQSDPTGAFHSANFFGTSALRHISEIKPDIVHLHWIGSDTLRIEHLAKINVPIVWTFHDMWPFCGAEHLAFPWSGARYREAYTAANRHTSSRGIDINRVTWQRKARHWRDKRMHAVVPSKWLKSCADKSMLSQLDAFRPSRLIHWGIDQSVFYKDDRNLCRKRFKIEDTERVLLFGSHMNRIPTKGFRYLAKSLDKLDTTISTTLLCFGDGALPFRRAIRTVHLGKINNANTLRQAYSASDLLLMPSLIESFGLVAAESMACGTPVVCFDTTGLRDVVGHQLEGYRAKQFDSEDFCRGIEWCLEDTMRLQSMSANAHKKVTKKFSLEQMCNAYQNLYEEVLR
jgi:glycosyltransferase involved in cell wall biosynthesis